MNRGFLLMRSLISANLRSKNYSTLPKEVTIYLDKETIVCWHPEQPFPYEYSLPLPDKEESNSVLKVDNKDVKKVFRKENIVLVAEELGKLTQTTRHIWFPRSRDAKAKKTLPDRKYL